MSQAIVNKLMNKPDLMDKLTQKVVQSGVLGKVNQELYESRKMDLDKSAEITAALHARIANMERSHQTLTDELDELDQYSRRNCFHH